MDPADRSTIARLYEATKFDRRLNMLTAPISATAMEQLLAAMKSGRPSVQISASVFLSLGVAQAAIPADEFDEIDRAAKGVVGTAQGSLRLHAERVVWHLRVTRIVERAERAEFLAPFLEDRGLDGSYLADSTVDYLAELGLEGEQVLRGFVSEETKRSLSPDVLERAKLGLRKVELARAVEQAGPADAVNMLAAAVRMPKQRQMDREFAKWVVGQLVAHRPEADSALRAMSADQTLTDEARLAAEFAFSDRAGSIRWR